MSEQRKYDRHDSIFYLEIFDRQTGKLLGHAVDLSDKGLMMITSQPVERGRQFALRLQLPEPVESGNRAVEFDAETRWCRQEANPDLYGVGLEITDPPGAFQRALQDLGRGYTFPGKQ